MLMKKYNPTTLSKIKRGSKRASYDQTEVFKVLDAHFMCHVPYVFDNTPITIPMAYARSSKTIYLHGAIGNRMLNSITRLDQMSITVTHLDGLVLARSAFHHSVNYRSVVVFGKPRIVTEESEVNHALECIVNQMVEGRWQETRPPNANELKATKVIALDITEASAKIRQGPPIDDEEDYQLKLWAGVVPLKNVYDKAINDPKLAFNLETPPSVKKITKNDR